MRPRGTSYGGFAILSLQMPQVQPSAAVPVSAAASIVESTMEAPPLPASFGLVQFYRLIQDGNGLFSADQYAAYPIPFITVSKV